MSQAKQRPTLDAVAGLAALEADLPRVLGIMGASSIEELGWKRPNKLSLLIPMSGTFGDKTDEYLLRLGFQAYRSSPPSAQFVNPETGTYQWPQDQHHVPILRAPGCRTHVAYDGPSGKMQLICCSATFEFYDVLHHVEPHHVWRDTDTFYTTYVAISSAFVSSYQGRHPAHGR